MNKRNIIVVCLLCISVYFVYYLCFLQERSNLLLYKTSLGDEFFYNIRTPFAIHASDKIAVFEGNTKLLVYSLHDELIDESNPLIDIFPVFEKDGLLVYRVNSFWNSGDTVREGYLMRATGEKYGKFIGLLHSSDTPPLSLKQSEMFIQAVIEIDRLGYADWLSEFFFTIVDNEYILSDERIRKMLYDISLSTSDEINTKKSLQWNMNVKNIVPINRKKILEIPELAKEILSLQNK